MEYAYKVKTNKINIIMSIIIIFNNIIVVGIISNFFLKGKKCLSVYLFIECLQEKERENIKIESQRPCDAAECV